MKNKLFPPLLMLAIVVLMQPLCAMDTMTTTDNVVIDYEVKGQGDALVMLHSGMMSREDMRIQIDYFSRFYQVIALDSREQGRSTSSQDQITYDLMAKDVIELLDHLGIEKASLFGQSDGGITALITVFKFPQRVKKLVIHGAVFNYKAYPEEQRERWLNYTWNANNERDTDPNRFPGMAIESYLLGRDDLGQFEDHLQEMATMWATAPNLEVGDLNGIQTPTLVIVGDHWDISLNHTIEMHQALGNSELFVVPGGTHFVHQEKPDLLHTVMHDFLMD